MIGRTQRSEEPAVLATSVAVLEGLLDVLLGVLALRDFLESIGGDGTLQTLKLKGVTGGHQVVVVDDLDERLDLAAAVDQLLTHAAGNLLGVALDTGDDGEGEGVSLRARVLRLDNDDLSKRIAMSVILNPFHIVIPLAISPNFTRSFNATPSLHLGHNGAPPLNIAVSCLLHISFPSFSFVLRGERRFVVPSYRRNGHG